MKLTVSKATGAPPPVAWRSSGRFVDTDFTLGEGGNNVFKTFYKDRTHARLSIIAYQVLTHVRHCVHILGRYSWYSIGTVGTVDVAKGGTVGTAGTVDVVQLTVRYNLNSTIVVKCRLKFMTDCV